MDALSLALSALEASRERFILARSAAQSAEAYQNARLYGKLIEQIDAALDALREEMLP